MPSGCSPSTGVKISFVFPLEAWHNEFLFTPGGSTGMMNSNGVYRVIDQRDRLLNSKNENTCLCSHEATKTPSLIILFDGRYRERCLPSKL
jgi:hypothetical protein